MEEVIIRSLSMCSKNTLIYSMFVLAYFVIIVMALCLGEENINPVQLYEYVFIHNDTLNQKIIDARLSRVVMAILIGMLLSSSGAITQNVFSNPIADPYIIGIASAATFGAIVAYLLGFEDYYGIFAFICSSIFSFFVFKIASKTSISILLIIGIATSSFLGAFTSFFTYVIGEDSFKVVAWLMGNIGLSSWYHVQILILPLFLSLLYFYINKNALNILLSGDEEAKNLGVDAYGLRIKLLIVSSLAVSFAVAFTGIIAFVGLIIPHVVRLIFKTYDNAIVIPYSIVFGGIFLLISDIIARTLLSPVQIPIGIITALFGSPIFLYLALKSKKGF
ncbi:FecCD family ABC transporter permease [Campylobacter lari]|uniref:FecCD family ABC transporter permease n=1 Tax=Campylobacter lari TaxID=201 RepID=UPI0027D4628E|nr:iron ABC transporter permease [Campylobacter lari]